MLHPVVLVSLALLLVNDHVLKGVGPPVVTGKLSDFAGLAFFPVLLFSLVELVTRRAPAARSVIIGCVIATVVVFTLAKVWTPAAEAYALAISVLQWPFRAAAVLVLAPGNDVPGLVPVRHTMDATDLVALPATLLALLVARRRGARDHSD